ncbi:MAG TPA: 50S ribosomal protein L17 [Candidatus Paceibacterota bacterium]
MLHHKKQRKLGRETDQRRALLRSLSRSLIKHEKITTTEAKAKEVRPFVERLVTIAKSDTPSSRRLIVSRLGGPDQIRKLFSSVAPKYKEKAGGYTRITKIARRKSDGSKMAIIEFV